MGSEHYCLRWNNHQSNLLGVFSQLLQDESLVDVTLACSEGASIRAHKVVLSACSSYFQSLFLDHPARHPIVILKDVRFAELRTLVEFMYKGEVNVQYCQLSALLKTAESLKVKGLAEMTNQSTAPRESEREAERLRSHSSIPLKSEHSDTIPTSPLKSTLSTLATSGGGATSAAGSSRVAEQQGCTERGTPSPTSLRHHQSSSPTPLAFYGSRRAMRDHQDRPPSMDESMEDEPLQLSTQSTTATTTTTTITSQHHSAEERPTSPDDDEEDDHMMQTNDVGLNMTLNSTASTATSSVVIPAASVSSTEVRPASRGGHTTATCISSSNSSGGGGGPPSQVSPSMPEPIAGPSGMGPVQQVPLSLKKEIDWDRGDDKDSSSSDYRHPHDTEATPPDVHASGGNQAGGPIYPCMYCGASFPHQSKLTRHILSHSLETLKYRETSHLLHPSHLSNLLPPQSHPADLASPTQHFSAAAAAVAAAAAASSRSSMLGDSLEPPDGLASPMDIEFAAVAAAAVAASSSAGGTSGAPGVGSSSSGAIKGEQGNVVLCKFCGKSFPDVSTLITHLPVHTGDRPFKCEFCGKAFKLRHHMKDHCRVHTGERPFKCSMCGKTFSRSTILKAHEKTHYPKYIDDTTIPLFGSSLLGAGALGGPTRCPTPFGFPFAPLGLGLFDADPSRMLTFLHHHQSLLAEEALRYRGLFMNPKDTASLRFNPLAEMFSKEQELFLKRANIFKNTFRYPLHAAAPTDIFASTSASCVTKDQVSVSSKDDRRSSTTTLSQRSFATAEKIDLTKPPTPTESLPGSSKDILDEILHKRSGNYLKEGYRFNPLSGSEGRRTGSPKDKSSSSTSSSPIIKPIPETLLLQDGTTIEEETKCTVCMATFPSVWLLEQHAALQHAGVGAMEEKPFICEQCGQSYRYRSAYVKHREQNHRARLPADKLFTCDVCGMQFRYLKSFKKHRLNHALERLHGKNEKKYGSMELGTEIVTSSNDDENELKITIKEEEDEEDQDDTVDSAGGMCNTEQSVDGDIVVPKITSSAETMEYGATNSGPMMVEREDQLIKKRLEMCPMPATSVNSLLTAERIPSDQALGLNPQEASILNFLRVDAAERQRDRRFACPFCGNTSPPTSTIRPAEMSSSDADYSVLAGNTPPVAEILPISSNGGHKSHNFSLH
ncbi:longitudinals lacking protein, isoforms A/B/D/L [Sergentomyia squamirostris]